MTANNCYLPEEFSLDSVENLAQRFQPYSGLYAFRTSSVQLAQKNSLPDQLAAWVYLPEQTEFSCWSVTLLMPNAEDPRMFLERTGWLEIADSEKILLFILRPGKEGWHYPLTREEFSFLGEMDSAIDKKIGYDAQRFFAYLVGYEEGASAALSYSICNPSSYAGLACIGSFDFDQAISSIQDEELELAPYLKKSKIPLPVAFFCTESTSGLESALAHFKLRNQVTDTRWEHNDVSLWLADQTQRRDSVNAQNICTITWKNCSTVMASDVWDVLHRTIRTSGVGYGFLHPYRTLGQWNLTEHSIVVQGHKRSWLEYVPERNVSRVEKRPLVFFFHGNSQTGKSAVYANEWMNVAESRNFIACFPTGGMTSRGNTMPVPGWNASASDMLLDDEAFIRSMVDNISSRYAIDKSRIYANGHSMGSAMVQRCAMAMPDLFAAVASNSGVVCGGNLGSFDLPGIVEDAVIPVWINMGEHDIGGGTCDANEDIRKTVLYWLNRYGLNDSNKGEFVSGRYVNTVWSNHSGVPLVRMTTTLDKPHSIMPQDPWLYYDELFAHFSREGDRLYYDGRAVE